MIIYNFDNSCIYTRYKSGQRFMYVCYVLYIEQEIDVLYYQCTQRGYCVPTCNVYPIVILVYSYTIRYHACSYQQFSIVLLHVYAGSEPRSLFDMLLIQCTCYQLLCQYYSYGYWLAYYMQQQYWQVITLAIPCIPRSYRCQCRLYAVPYNLAGVQQQHDISLIYRIQ